jgi:hypothetical protein
VITKVIPITNPNFKIGTTYMSEAVKNDIPSLDIYEALQRHLTERWGDVGHKIQKANAHAIKYGGKVLSKHYCQSRPFYILTNADHNSTILVVEEDIWEY